uniref:Amidinotransferase n=1 Tax=viral metagenome TaxID=1070528 RepID=A0A6C0CTF8_9ZZZZ
MLLLIRPNYFATNQQALSTNAFMNSSKEAIEEKAIAEHNGLIQELFNHHIDFIFYENLNPQTLDALFANNWITVHLSQNKMMIYPMYLENRRLEVRWDIIEDLYKMYPNLKIYDLRSHSFHNALEGTGSMVFDHENRIIYAAVSKRTNELLLRQVGELLNYHVISFYTEYKNEPVYHTNVMMAIGKTWAVVCTQVIDHDDVREVVQSILESGKQMIEISTNQMEAFCGNVLEVYNRDKVPYTVMSDKAKKAFLPCQLISLGNIISVPFDTIETYGGGGVRCCLTEIE